MVFFTTVEKKKRNLLQFALSRYLYLIVRDNETKLVKNVPLLNSLDRFSLAEDFLKGNTEYDNNLKTEIAHYIDLRIPYYYYKIANTINVEYKENYQGVASAHPDLMYQFPESYNNEGASNPNFNRHKKMETYPSTIAQIKYLQSLAKNAGYTLRIPWESLNARQADVLIRFFVDDIEPSVEDFYLLEYDI